MSSRNSTPAAFVASQVTATGKAGRVRSPQAAVEAGLALASTSPYWRAMTWLSTGDEQAGLPHILRAHSANKAALRGHLQLYRAVMFGESGLSRTEGEAMAVAVSAVDDCHEGVVHHSDAVTRESGDASLAEAVVSGDHEVLGGRLHALLDYAVALTVEPHAVGRDAVERLRRASLPARDVVAIRVTAYFSYVDRIAERLGVELEDDWPDHVAAPRAHGLRERYLSKAPRDG